MWRVVLVEQRIDDGHLFVGRPYYNCMDHVDTWDQGLCHLRVSSLHKFQTLGCFVAYKGQRAHFDITLVIV